MEVLLAEINRFISLSEQTYFILLSLASSPKHGYAIVKEVQHLSDERVILSVSTLYTTLKRLLDDGWIRLIEKTPKKSQRPRKVYELTALGSNVLQDELRRLEGLVSAARKIGKVGGVL